jgi:hypothetical protein
VSHLFHFVVRPTEALLGLFCVLTAIVLYPGEEGRIQSKFEDFWITVDDYGKTALSFHAAFMQQVAQLESRLLNALFGVKLWTVRSVTFSFSCSLTITGAYTLLAHEDFYGSLSGLFLTHGLVLGVVSFLGWRVMAIAWTGIAIEIIYQAGTAKEDWFFTKAESIELLFILVGILVAICMAGLLCDIAFVSLTRQLLRWAGKMTQTWKIAGVVTANLLLSLMLISPYLAQKFTSRCGAGSGIWHTVLCDYNSAIVSVTNFFDVVLSLIFALLALTLLLHRLMWPLLTRTLFRMQDIGTKGRRAILTTIGMALLSASIFGGKVPDLFKSFVKIFGG